MSGEFTKYAGQSQYLPLMPLREVVIFPHSIMPLFVGRGSSIKAVDAAFNNHDKRILLVAQRTPEQEKPGSEDLFELGTIAKILQVLRLPDGTIKVLFEGLTRAFWSVDDADRLSGESYTLAKVEALAEDDLSSNEAMAAINATLEVLEEYNKLNKKIPPESFSTMQSINSPGRLADMVMSYLKVDYRRKQTILEVIDPVERLLKVFDLVQGEIAVASVERSIKNRVKNQMERNQREYYLNEQIKAIHKEMGREDDPQAELVDLEKRMQEKDMPEEARERGLSELKKLRYMSTSAAEYTVVRNYVDWILDLPWNSMKETKIDIRRAKEILDEDHFGLEKPKERILEYLAVQKLSKKLKGPILCFVGPPGVGKTSLARSVSRATQREFVRLSLGGVRDEAEIRGHRRTYVGALPGKIIQSLKRVKSSNPLFCLDEIDKLSSDFRGDPASALLEVLDPEQNDTFNDHYLDLDYNLSQVFFITTANSLHSIPEPLKDRMEIINLPGYLETEKMHIAKDFLLPKQLDANGLSAENVTISDNAIMEIIRSYTREAGVRNLEREIATVCRKSAMQLVEELSDAEAEGADLDAEALAGRSVKVGLQTLGKLLGVKKYRYGEKEDGNQVGVCTGLGYTGYGGDILLVETAIMPGTGKVNITGKLGDVMKESAQAALAYVRSRSGMLGLRPDFHKDIDIHIHVPDGATPKDGPSAGITLTTSLVSALLGIPVRNDVAMTGEITLRGRVLAIGGLREKLLAAGRANITTVIVPKDNDKDMKEIPEAVTKGLDIHFADNFDDVLPLALQMEDAGNLLSLKEPVQLYQSLKAREDLGTANAQ
ncbi:endopeptidase La [Desulfovibrio sp. OttesenSCG-928-C14]|nr:endopeptidase La [Desulfovibrio sp. OttesenSCG-928-C14]